jgi:Flp pilus assembly pilin Flp
MMQPCGESESPCWREIADMQHRPSETGSSLVEYALVLVLIVIVVIAVYLLVEPAIGNIISQLKAAP